MSVRASFITAAALAFGFGGCLDRQVGTVGGVADASTASEDVSIDAPSDLGDGGVDTDKPEAPACILVEHIAKVGAIDFGAEGGAASFLPPFIDGARVVGHARGTEFGNAPDDTEVIGVSVGDGETEQLTANAGDDVVVDARDGVLLVERTAEGGLRQLLRVSGGVEEVLEAEVSGAAGYAPWVEQYNGVGRRRVWGSRAAWRYDGQLRWYAEGAVTTVYASEEWIGSPDGHGESAVFATESEAVGATKVLLYRQGQLATVVDDGRNNRFPVLGAERVYWNVDGAIVSKRLDSLDEPPEVLAEGPCGVPSADGDWAVFACASDPSLPFSGGGPFWTEADVLYAYDGIEVRQIPTSGANVLSPVVVAGRVGWAEYEDVSGGGDFANGDLWVASSLSDGSWLKTAIAPIGSGCYSCQVPAAPVQVRLSNSGAAWNYPIAPDVNPNTAIGYASLQDTYDCP